MDEGEGERRLGNGEANRAENQTQHQMIKAASVQELRIPAFAFSQLTLSS